GGMLREQSHPRLRARRVARGLRRPHREGARPGLLGVEVWPWPSPRLAAFEALRRRAGVGIGILIHLGMYLYHGSDHIEIHPGLCLTDDLDTAENYALQWDLLGTPMVATVHLDLTGLRVVEVNAYDRNNNRAIGDNDLTIDADVIVYDD